MDALRTTVSDASLHAIDWLAIAGYFALVLTIGALAARRSGRGGDEFLLAGRSMPVWAVAISVLATSQSAATFVGGPQQSFDGNLTYLAANIAVLLASIIVAFVFLPAFYRRRVTSIYELLGQQYGTGPQRMASAMFMIGRVFAGGARLFILAVPFSLVAFGETTHAQMVQSILIIVVVAAAYTMLGGIRAVIWTDVLQAGVYIGAIALALLILWQKIPLSLDQAVDVLRSDPAGDKLRVFQWSADSPGDFFTQPYSMPAIICGLTLLMLAAYGTDQDLAQRMLTCKSPARGGWSMILATIIGWPVVVMFLLMGLLMFVFYNRPDIMGDAAPLYTIDRSHEVFIEFIRHEMPMGVRGLMLAGLFAAAMSSLDSELNAMASTIIADFYRPWRLKRDREYARGNRAEVIVSRWAIVFWAANLGGFACLCVWWYDHSEQRIIDFALNVMVFAYSGLLAVFLTALLTRRGNAQSVIAALVTGFIAVLAMRPALWGPVVAKLTGSEVDVTIPLAFPWQMLIATTLSFVVCCTGKRKAVAQASRL